MLVFKQLYSTHKVLTDGFPVYDENGFCLRDAGAKELIRHVTGNVEGFRWGISTQLTLSRGRPVLETSK